jgi:nitroimidazol reductase NimA-like FMN-containing flavoprotein (pyridoxamine 5'-phosphate oxidase superfamily)
MAKGSMSRAERESFVADVRVAVLAIDEPGRGPLAIPIWYLWENGEFVFGMDADSLKADLLEHTGRATVTVQDETPPYKYVSVEGPVRIELASHDSLELATRYLGPEIGKLYNDANPNTPQTVTVHLTPEHWRTFDFAKLLT